MDELPTNLVRYFCKFKTTNHNLPIEKGRHLGVDRNLRFCSQCNKNLMGDEFHYLFECEAFKEIRIRLLKKCYYCYPNAYKLDKLMNCKKQAELKKTSSIL